MLCVRMLGSLKVAFTDVNATPHMAPQSQGLLAYLLVYRHRLHAREALADQFWGDASPGRARLALNTALWRLRMTLEPPGVAHGTYVVARGNAEVGFNAASPHWIDVEEMENRLKPLMHRSPLQLTARDADAIEGALELYTADLLEGMRWDWVIHERERLRQIYLDGLGHLMHHYATQHMYPEGIRCGQRILATDPLREAVHRDIMRMHFANGQRALAVRQFALCAAVLKDQLEIEPMHATRLLYDQIISGEESQAASLADAYRLGGAHTPPSTSEGAAPGEVGRPLPDNAGASEPVAPEVLATMRSAFQHLEMAYRDLARLGIGIDDALRLLGSQRPDGALPQNARGSPDHASGAPRPLP